MSLRRRILQNVKKEEYSMLTGTAMGDGTQHIDIEVPFEPDFIVMSLSDDDVPPGITCICGITLIRDLFIQGSTYNANSSIKMNGGFSYKCTGLQSSEVSTINATYTDGILHIYVASSGRKLLNNGKYNWTVGQFK